MSFNSRPHTEVDQVAGNIKSGTTAFQLTTSHGGRLRLIISRILFMILSTHDLTRRSTKILEEIEIRAIFQLTTSHGGRHLFQIDNTDSADLSTHDLTRRSTANFL